MRTLMLASRRNEPKEKTRLTCLPGRMIPATGRFRFWRWIKDLHKFILKEIGLNRLLLLIDTYV
jgi:hypothetical protein